MAQPPKTNRDAMKTMLDTGETRSFQTECDGWRMHVVFQRRNNARLIVPFTGVEVRDLWQVTALYAHRPDVPDGSTVVEWPGGNGNLFIEDASDDHAWDLTRGLWRAVRNRPVKVRVHPTTSMPFGLLAPVDYARLESGEAVEVEMPAEYAEAHEAAWAAEAKS